MSYKDGGPAFPHRLPRVEREGSALHQRTIPVDREGMTLRDYFAIHADQPGIAEISRASGLGALSAREFEEWWADVPDDVRFALYAKVRYQMADAMLTERAK